MNEEIKEELGAEITKDFVLLYEKFADRISPENFGIFMMTRSIDVLMLIGRAVGTNGVKLAQNAFQHGVRAHLDGTLDDYYEGFDERAKKLWKYHKNKEKEDEPATKN